MADTSELVSVVRLVLVYGNGRCKQLFEAVCNGGWNMGSSQRGLTGFRILFYF